VLAARHAIGDDNDVFGDLYLVRLVSVVIGVLTVLFAWLAFGQAFGPGQAQRIATGLVALLPMPTFLRSGVNADVMVALFVSIAFWLAVRSLRAERAISIRGSIVMGLVLAGGVLTKQTFVIIVAAWMLVLLFELVRRRSRIIGAIARAVVSLGAIAMGAGWFFAASPSVGVTNDVTAAGAQLLSPTEYLRQVSSERWLNMVNEWWGVFGWLDTPVSGDWYRMLKVFTLVTVVVGVLALVRALGSRRVDPVLLLAGVWCLAWVVALLYVEFNLMRSGKSGPFLQGRYFMPVLVPTIALGVAAWRSIAGIDWLRWLRPAAVLALPVAAAYHIAALLEFVIPRYYL
jgi:4-amino-4-deoxy-L-arabinose transferase-like glycosyltransferase